MNKVLRIVRSNLDQMMRDRNTVFDPNSIYTGDLSSNDYDSIHIDSDGNKTYIIFVETTIENNKKYLTDFNKKLKVFTKTKPGNKTRVIIVSEIAPISSQMKSVLNMFSEYPPQFFVYSSMPEKEIFFNPIINPTNHNYSPKATLLSSDEIKKELEDISLQSLPKIKLNDPIVKWYGGIVGDVFKFERRNIASDTTVLNSVYYRIVKAD